MIEGREEKLLLDAYSYGITSPKELANFMAQTTYESQGLVRLEESFKYTHGNAQITVRSAHHDETKLDAARLDALHGKPEQLGDLMYGGRMGNNEPGDGYKYRGRGYIQLTGKENYAAAGKAIGEDLVNNPDLAAQPEYAGKLAIWFWNQYVHRVAPEEVTEATRIVNNGYTGLVARKELAVEWEKVLTHEVMANLSKGAVDLASIPVAFHSGRVQHHKASLRLGLHGEAVNTLQTQLNELGYLNASPDGQFGSATKAAVRAFQRDHGVRANGVDGPATQRSLQADVARLQEHSPFTFPAMQAASEPGLDDPRHALNPDHALYATLKRRIPDASEERLVQFTAACHMKRITADKLEGIYLNGTAKTITFAATLPLGVMAEVDLKQPLPTPQQAIQQMQHYDMQHAQQVQFDAQMAQQQSGPTMGGPGGHGRR
ncbi:peptidoglycan-binding protein [Dyella psychrodurans]|uniref:Lytic enzyme n=1 Tax=Dyella psychrodurans TaxID=1927960 RepID=A0A370WYB2_9GAMM|nr:peptidoglycan-binding protein [Dyella psychrodurans]RDS81030.1 lytic enzyme [Dyella psychrodurans]